jgi:hypothetical protein
MTEKANPSINRPVEAFKTAGAIAYGGSDEGFISPSNSPTEISVQDDGINEAQLNAFDETSSGSSLDVTLDGGEAFVFGSWLAIDSSTSVSLAADTVGQTVSVGWNKNGADDVIVGLDAAFSSASGDADQKIPLFTFDTDSSGVTNVADERSFDQIAASSVEQGAGSGLDADTLDGVEASELGGGDIANSGTVVTTSTDEIDFTDNLVASDDGDGTSTVTLDSTVSADLFEAEDLFIHGKTLESGETITIGSDSGAVVSEEFTVDGTLNVNQGGSLTVTGDVVAPPGGYSAAVTKTADHTALDRQVVLADASSGDIDITLPSPQNGQLVTVKKIDSSNNAVDILTPGSETIDGQNSISITNQFAARETISNGTDYFII